MVERILHSFSGGIRGGLHAADYRIVDEEDAYLTSLIAQAQAAAEDYCRTQFSDPAPEPVRLAVLLMVGFYYENRDIPDMTTYKAMRMAFDSLLYPYRDPEKMF